MNAYKKELDEDEFETELNGLYGEVDICGQFFDSGSALRVLDPIAFGRLLAGISTLYVCGACGSHWEEDKEGADMCCT